MFRAGISDILSFNTCNELSNEFNLSDGGKRNIEEFFFLFVLKALP